MVRISTLCWAVTPGFGLCHCCSLFCSVSLSLSLTKFQVALCSSLHVWFTVHWTIWVYFPNSASVALSLFEVSPFFGLPEKQVLGACLWVGWFDPSGMWDQNQDKAGMLLSIHHSLAGCGCLSWCCLDESRSPQSQMVPFVFTILAHFCSFSLLAWISKHKKWGFHQLPVF